MRGALHQPLDPLAEPDAVIGDIEQVGVRRRIGRQVGAGHLVFGVVGEQRQPFRQPPLIEQIGFGKQEVFNVGSAYGMHVDLLRLQRL